MNRQFCLHSKKKYHFYMIFWIQQFLPHFGKPQGCSEQCVKLSFYFFWHILIDFSRTLSIKHFSCHLQLLMLQLLMYFTRKIIMEQDYNMFLALRQNFTNIKNYNNNSSHASFQVIPFHRSSVTYFKRCFKDMTYLH